MWERNPANTQITEEHIGGAACGFTCYEYCPGVTPEKEDLNKHKLPDCIHSIWDLGSWETPPTFVFPDVLPAASATLFHKLPNSDTTQFYHENILHSF